MPKISLLGANLSQEALIKRKIGITLIPDLAAVERALGREEIKIRA